MKKYKVNLLKLLVLFITGGFIYVLLELLWRSYSHWTMFIVGGLCFVLIGFINEIFTWSMSLVFQMMVSSIIITLVEFLSGYIINIKFGLSIWDYSNMPYNILGQICIPFMGLWFLLSAIGIFLDDYLRYLLFKEELPKYHLI